MRARQQSRRRLNGNHGYPGTHRRTDPAAAGAHGEEADREEIVMPKVGKKEYPYTKKGKAQAKTAAKRMGTKVKYGGKKKA